MDDEKAIEPVQNLSNAQKMDILSGALWRVLQKQTRKPNATARLKPLARCRFEDPVYFTDTDLFSSQDSADVEDLDLFEDEDIEDDSLEVDDELLFGERSDAAHEIDGLRYHKSNRMFDGQITGGSAEDAMLFENILVRGDSDDDLLLDLMMDEGTFAE